MLIKERYRLLKQTGQGGFGKTFVAVDEGQSPAIPCVVQQFGLQNQKLETFEQKAQRLEELGKHPQIPALLAHFEENHHLYLVQEFIEGTNLATLVEKEGAFSETQIWQLLENLLPVLKYVHAHNLIHCDIKPENIILKSPSNFIGKDLVLVDFGAARTVTSIDLTSDSLIGSAEYAAPEQAKGNLVVGSDLYSLGVTCIYLLTQIPPFDLFDIADDCWVWRQYLTTKVSEGLGKILDKLVQKDFTQRFESADEVMQAMGIHCPSVDHSITPPSRLLWQCSHTLTSHLGMLSSVNSIAIHPDGNILASGHDNKTIKLWDLNSKKQAYTFAGHCQAVKSVAFSPDGKILATASDDKTIKLWNLNTLEEIRTLFGHAHGVKSVAFSPDGELLASGSWDKTVKLWNVKTGEEICTLTGHQLQVSAVAFSPDGQLLASASFDRTIRLWSKGEFKNRPHYTFLGILSGHAWAVLAIAFSPNGNLLATGSDDNTIKLWEVNTGQVISTLLGHSWSVVTLAFSADGETLISGSRDKIVKFWSVSTKQEVGTLSGHVDSVSTVAISPDAQVIASGSRDKTIKLWELVQQ
ncbi:protein kinase [Scytonema sp. HK-05]|uniref:serine/threonine-protein kinase n=1 Tax=Scytonema sp. HK-05 TaxID=1137095 RepID=UPI0009358CD2|nr:serine/threonine-protein kinase [Scytonema sp. HK-05]OKH60790.1 serine/threonine protein kinase [Scytonema sp. HK-05]BAY45088.1 protein kinase [Scytonema sp. HK-05]